MTGTVSPFATPAGEADDRGWLRSLHSLVAVSGECDDAELSRTEALVSLRCGSATLDHLVEEGLQAHGPRGQERFKRSDLFNLALYSGSRRSEAELAVSFALRWMGEGPEALCAPARWSFDIELECPRGDGCGVNPSWTLARPQPEVFGGRILSLTVDPHKAERPGSSFVASGEAPLRVSAVVETNGARRSITSPVLRAIVDDFRGLDLRYSRLPPPMQWDYERLLPHGVTTCYAASRYLENRCRSAGLRCWTRRGWLMGLLDLPHAWLEVEDVDGSVKVIDAVFALLSEQLAPHPHPDFAELCMGSMLNRLLPSNHRADQPLVAHFCGGQARLVRTRTQIRLVEDADDQRRAS